MKDTSISETVVIAEVVRRGEQQRELLDTLRPEDFSQEEHRQLFARARAMYLKGQPVNATTLGMQQEDPHPHPSDVVQYHADWLQTVRWQGHLAKLNGKLQAETDPLRLDQRFEQLQTLMAKRPWICGRQFRVYTMEEIMAAEVPPVPWVVERLFAEGDIAVVSGPPRRFKTYLLVQLALCLASGRDFLDGLFPIARPYRVLMLDEENKYRRMQRRLMMVAHALGIDRETARALPIRLISDEGFRWDDPQKLQLLRRVLTDYRPDVVTCDSFVRTNTVDENQASEISRLFETCIKPVRREFDLTLVFAHHWTKPQGRDTPRGAGNRLRGSGDIEAVVDAHFALRPTREPGRVQFEQDKIRDEEEFEKVPLEVKKTDDGEGLCLVPAGIHGQGKVAECQAHIEEIARYSGGKDVPREQFMKILGTKYADATKKRALDGLVTEGKLERRKDGRTSLYTLIEFIPDPVNCK